MFFVEVFFVEVFFVEVFAVEAWLSAVRNGNLYFF